MLWTADTKQCLAVWMFTSYNLAGGDFVCLWQMDGLVTLHCVCQ